MMYPQPPLYNPAMMAPIPTPYAPGIVNPYPYGMMAPYPYGMPQFNVSYQDYYQQNPFSMSKGYQYTENQWRSPVMKLIDHGPQPYVVNITDATKQNTNYRTALWTGHHLQTTLMHINPGDDIGLEVHPEHDQFIRIEQGTGQVMMGPNPNQLTFQQDVGDDFAIFVPAGMYHNLVNTGLQPLKLYSIYAPVTHPHGTVEPIKADADQENPHR